MLSEVVKLEGKKEQYIEQLAQSSVLETCMWYLKGEPEI